MTPDEPPSALHHRPPDPGSPLRAGVSCAVACTGRRLMGKLHEISEPRRSGVDNVRPIRPSVDVNPRHPSVMYDRSDEDNAAHTCVLLTQGQARAIASLLRAARSHLPSPRACDEALRILMAER